MSQGGDFKIKVEIVAQDNSGAGLASVENSLQGVESALEKIKAKSQGVGADNGIKVLASDALKAQAATDKLHASVGRSTSVLQDMGRIIQDMPYGIQGIGNNIQPLVESFGRLKAETGSTGGAVQALLSGIGGPAGLAMIGIPLVTSLAIAFSGPLMQAIGGAGNKVEDLQKKLAGIEQYKDFDLTIRIAGLDGIARLKAELNQLIQKKAYLENSSRLEAAAKASAPSVLDRVVGGALYGQYYTPGAAYYQSKSALQNYNVSTAQSIASGKMSLGPEEDVRFLTQYLKKSKEDALHILATNKVNLDIAVKEAGIKLQGSKDSEKSARSGVSAAKATEAAANKAETQQQKWTKAVADADKALSGIGNHVKSIAEAKADVAFAEAEVKKLKAGYGEGKRSAEELADATKTLTEAQNEQKRAQSEWAHTLKDATNLLDKKAVSELSVVDARAVEATARLNLETAVLAKDNVAAKEATIAYRVAIDDTAEAVVNAEKRAQSFAASIKNVGDLLGGRVGDALAGMGIGLKYLMTEPDTKGMTTAQAQQAKDLQQIAGKSSVVSGLGKVIGGRTGSGISKFSTGAAAGMGTAVALGAAALGPVGILAGALGGALGLIGGGQSGPTQAQSDALSMSQKNAEAIFALAQSGSETARAIVARSGFSVTNLAGNNYTGGTSTPQSSYSGIGIDKYLTGIPNLALTYTKENKYNTALVDDLTAMQQIKTVIAAIASPAIVQTLADIQYKYDVLAAKSGTLANAETARLAEMTIALTGFTNDSLSTVLDSVVTSTNPADVGAVFGAKVTEALATSIRNIQIGAFLQAVITPVLQPLYADIAQSMAAGADTSAGFASIKSALETLTPTVTAFAQSLTTQGVAGYTAVAATDALTTATEALATAQRTAVDIAQGRYGLETTLLQLQGDTVQLRARELALLDPTNQALQNQIWALQDQQAAADAAASATSGAADSLSSFTDAAKALQDALSLSMQAVTKSVTAQKDAQQKIYDSAAKVLNNSLAAVASTISKLTTLNDDLKSAVSAMTMQEGALDKYKTAQQDIFAALAAAKIGSALPVDGQLKSALSTVSQDSTSLFGSRLDYQRDFFRTVGAVTALSALAGSQLTDAQQSQSLQQSQLTALTAGFEAEQSRLDALLTQAQDQVAAAQGTRVAVLSVTDSIAALYALLGGTAPSTSPVDRVVFGSSTGGAAPVSESAIVSVLEGLRDDLAAQNAQIAINTRDTAAILDWWRVNGMPATEAV